MNKKDYLRIIEIPGRSISHKLKDIWLGSLIHESNPNKSRIIHAKFTNTVYPVYKFPFVKSILSAVKKYFIFV